MLYISGYGHFTSEGKRNEWPGFLRTYTSDSRLGKLRLWDALNSAQDSCPLEVKCDSQKAERWSAGWGGAAVRTADVELLRLSPRCLGSHGAVSLLATYV